MGTTFKARKAKFGEVEENRGFPIAGVRVNWSMFPESTLGIGMRSLVICIHAVWSSNSICVIYPEEIIKVVHKYRKGLLQYPLCYKKIRSKLKVLQ